jgi:hypothetical protein
MEEEMIDGNIYRMKELYNDQNMEYIEKTILSVLKEQKVSLSQVRVIFNHLLIKIEDENIINL